MSTETEGESVERRRRDYAAHVLKLVDSLKSPEGRFEALLGCLRETYEDGRADGEDDERKWWRERASAIKERE